MGVKVGENPVDILSRAPRTTVLSRVKESETPNETSSLSEESAIADAKVTEWVIQIPKIFTIDAKCHQVYLTHNIFFTRTENFAQKQNPYFPCCWSPSRSDSENSHCAFGQDENKLPK